MAQANVVNITGQTLGKTADQATKDEAMAILRGSEMRANRQLAGT